MKNFIKYGLAAAMVFATAMPAMAARSWVVCVDQSKDVRLSSEATPPATPATIFVGRLPSTRGAPMFRA
jgi:hypothetical protein